MTFHLTALKCRRNVTLYFPFLWFHHLLRVYYIIVVLTFLAFELLFLSIRNCINSRRTSLRCHATDFNNARMIYFHDNVFAKIKRKTNWVEQWKMQHRWIHEIFLSHRQQLLLHSKKTFAASSCFRKGNLFDLWPS